MRDRPASHADDRRERQRRAQPERLANGLCGNEDDAPPSPV